MEWYPDFESACAHAQQDHRPVMVILHAPG